jgi:hypothetical protein
MPRADLNDLISSHWTQDPTIRPRPVDPPAPRPMPTVPQDMPAGLLRLYFVAPDAGAVPFPGSYLAAVTDFTEMVSPLAVPVTLASSQASLLRLSSAA